MVIGRRWNVRWNENLTLYLPEQVTQIACAYGTLHIVIAVDYFAVARNEFPWHRLPDVVIARRGYDNFLVMMAIEQNVSVVDVSQTMVAVHQTDDEAMAKWRHRVKHEINMKLLGKFRPGKGTTASAQYVTKLVTDKSCGNVTDIVIMRRRTTKTRSRSRRRYDKSTSLASCTKFKSRR